MAVTSGAQSCQKCNLCAAAVLGAWVCHYDPDNNHTIIALCISAFYNDIHRELSVIVPFCIFCFWLEKSIF